METLSLVITIAAIVLGVILLLRILAKPFRFIFKLLLNTALGFVLLWIINFFGGEIGLTLSLSLVLSSDSSVFPAFCCCLRSISFYNL